MPGSSAFGYTNRTEKGYCLKVFPKDPKRRALWAAKVKRLNWVPTDNSFLCEVHFDADQWKVTGADGRSNGRNRSRKKLKGYAVPTLFDNIPKHHKRKLRTERSIIPNKILKVKDELSSKENKTIMQVDTFSTKLKRELMHAYETIIQLKKQKATLRYKLKLKTAQVSKYKKSGKKQYVNTFNEDQLQSIKRKTMVF
ncbi:unnamed protein product [Larinioides sclopetarius]|uniref:THAP-type domain-containing protein n=1 Tax=Larinioides sclopetarius TaxID=280406 RepID=A0AAV2BEF9_9ARAC